MEIRVDKVIINVDADDDFDDEQLDMFRKLMQSVACVIMAMIHSKSMIPTFISLWGELARDMKVLHKVYGRVYGKD